MRPKIVLKRSFLCSYFNNAVSYKCPKNNTFLFCLGFIRFKRLVYFSFLYILECIIIILFYLKGIIQ